MPGYIGYESEYDLGGFNYIQDSKNSIVRNGLVLYVDAANKNSYPSSGTTWFDLSGNGNHGSIVGGVSYNSSEKFFNFDGINGYVDFGSASAGSDSSNFTFSAWFKNITPGTISYVLLRGTDGLGAGWSLRIAVQADLRYQTASVTTSPSTVANNVNSTPSVVENSWVNITGVWINGVSMSQYINGVLQSTINFSGTTLRSSTTGWVAGRSSTTTTFYSRLNLAVAHVYNRALSQSEILQNFNATRGRYGI